MQVYDWEHFLSVVSIDGALHRVAPEDISRCEARLSVRLPPSYRDYCLTFGPGRFDTGFRIATPGQADWHETCELEKINDFIPSLDLEHELESIGQDRRWLRDVLWFADTIYGDHLFFDPARCTKAEYPVFIMYHDREVIFEKLADSFYDFFSIVCLTTGLPYPPYYYVERRFSPYEK